jgi:hypothetical protein
VQRFSGAANQSLPQMPKSNSNAALQLRCGSLADGEVPDISDYYTSIAMQLNMALSVFRRGPHLPRFPN